MHASFRGRKRGDWDKKELANVFQFVTELQLETPQDSDESTCIVHESNGSKKSINGCPHTPLCTAYWIERAQH